MKKKVYLSLPISHHDIDERRLFAERRERYLCETQGYDVVNPLKNGVPVDADWRVHMRQDFKDMLECDKAFFCDGWQSSCGCQLEHSVAVACGLDIIYEKNIWTAKNDKR